MWILKSQKTGTSYHLCVGQAYSIGRKDASILIENDPSISRKHAVLTVVHLDGDVADPLKLPSLKVEDVGSKYGTSKNGNKVTGQELVNDGDSIKFGQFESVFSVCYVPFVITTSCVDSSVKKELKKAVQQLGGHVVSEWKPHCTHLVMSDIKITIKAVCCLISQKPLVSPRFVIDMVKNISAGLPEPIPNKYIPPVGEAIIEANKANFDIVPDRKTIFKNKIFIFLDRSQFKKMEFAVTLGGGKAVYFSSGSSLVSKDFIRPGTSVVQPQAQDTKTLQNQISDLLHRNKKRMIQESDFGLAVSYCSTEMFCNPDCISGPSQSIGTKLYSQSLTQRESYDIPRNESLARRPDCSIPVGSIPISNQSTSMQEAINITSNGKKRKSMNTHDSMDTVQQSSKQMKLEKFLNITSSKANNVGKAANSIDVEEIALGSSSVKEEPHSADEMEVDNSSVFIYSPPVQKLPTPIRVEVSLSDEPPASNCSVKSLPKEVKKKNSVRSSSASAAEQNAPIDTKAGIVLNGDNANQWEENLPRNLIQVAFADLICVRPNRATVVRSINSSNCVNFKKFRKVLSHSARILPRIIGGHELEPYSKQASRALDEILNDSCDVQVSHNLDDDDAGEFDWESQSRHRKR